MADNIMAVIEAYDGMIRVYRANDKFAYHEYEGPALVPEDVKNFMEEGRRLS